MKRILPLTLATVLMGSLAFSTVSLGANVQNQNKGSASKGSGTAAAAQKAPAKPAPAPAITAEDKAGLEFMREEEKMARDVYLYFFDLYGARIFTNIAASEQQHTDAIKALLDKYGVADPAAGLKPGLFKNPDLQDLYHALIDRGSLSLAEALTVGQMIEETDIADLEKTLAGTTRTDIRTVYTNLMKASYNHLAAFKNQLAKK